MQVIGICRFSYPATGGFQIEHDTFESRCAYLYDPARMEDRFRQFSAITLPSIRAQTDQDFLFLVVTGENLPTIYMDRLRALTEDIPQVKIAPYPPGTHRKVMQLALNEHRGDDLNACLQFRHDDDDAVALTFVARLREAADDCSPLCQKHNLVGIDFNRGFVASADSSGICAAPIVTPYWGVAQGAVVAKGTSIGIMNFSHFRINQFMPTITFTDSDMYIRGHNDFNDSRQGKNAEKTKLTPLDSEGAAHFKKTFNIDVDHVRQIFSAPT